MKTFSKKPRRVALLVGALAAAASASGCSWLFVQPVPAMPERGDIITCTTNRAAPIVDTIFVSTNLASVVYAGTLDNATNKAQGVALGLTVATLWALSAGYGFMKTAECENAKDGIFNSSVPDPRPQYWKAYPRANWTGPPVAPTPPTLTAPPPRPVVPAAPAAPYEPPQRPGPPVPQRPDDEAP